MANVSISGTRNQNGGHRRRAEGQQDVVMVRHAGLQPARVLSAHPDDCSSAFGHAVGQPFADASAEPGQPFPEGCGRSEEHTSELQSLMRISYAVFCLKKKNKHTRSKTVSETQATYTPQK